MGAWELSSTCSLSSFPRRHSHRLRDFFVLRGAFGAADPYRADDLIAMLDRDPGLQRGKIRRQSGHCDSAFVDDVFEVFGGFLEQCRGFAFPMEMFGLAVNVFSKRRKYSKCPPSSTTAIAPAGPILFSVGCGSISRPFRSVEREG